MKTLRLLSHCMILASLYLVMNGCSKKIQTPPSQEVIVRQSASISATTSYSSLITYKNSPHEIYAVFYRMWGPCYGPRLDSSKIYNVPDSLDILILFCFDPSSPVAGSLPSWVDTLHAKGTKVIRTGNLNLVSGATHDSTGYALTAKYIMDSLVNKYHLDGYDIDVESNPSGQTLTDETGVYTALSKYLGPKSGTGKLLTFDTNQPSSNALFQNVHSMVSYVWYQDYGRGTVGLSNTESGYAQLVSSTQFVPGFSFYEENGYPGNYWGDVNYPIVGQGTGNAYNLASWEPRKGKKGGVFGYAIDRDQPLQSNIDNTMYYPNWIVSKQLIQVMNPHL